jgi:hypothetical protein
MYEMSAKKVFSRSTKGKMLLGCEHETVYFLLYERKCMRCPLYKGKKSISSSEIFCFTKENEEDS